MTSRPSRPRPSSGSSRAIGALAFALTLATARGASASSDATPLRETRGGVEVDWAEGTLVASGGAAADLRMPSAELARPGAVRRARAAALAKLRAALGDLPLGGGRTLSAPAVEQALGRARIGPVDYQSNGGAMLRATVRFTDWLDGGGLAPAGAGAADAPPVAVVAVASARLVAAPLAKLSGREAAIGAAQYHLGPPPPGTKALPARVDRSGRLVLEGPSDLAPRLARGLVVIYVQKVLR
jgi:hypothetical protein